MNNINRFLALSFFLLGIAFFTGCGSSSSPGVALTGIEISPAAVPDGLPIDVAQTFTATGTFSNNTKRDITREVTWGSSAAGIATIDASGVATGVATGATNITATMTGRTSNTVALNVINPNLTSIVIAPPAVPTIVQVDRTLGFKAEGVFDNNKSYDVTNLVDWNSEFPQFATIAQTGVATGVLAGTTNITAVATVVVPNVTSNTVALEVVQPNPTGMVIEPQTFDPLPVNRNQQFKALLLFDNNSAADITNTSLWVSDNTAVATVITSLPDGANGQVTGVSEGEATITVTDNNSSQSATVKVTVNDATITAVTVSPASPNDLPAGFTQDFTATGTFTDGKTRKLSDPVSWAIDDTSVASFEKKGETATVNGLKPGQVKVTYTDVLADGKESGQAGSSDLTVTNAILNSITINPNAAFSIPAGGQTSFTALGLYSDSSGRDITTGVTWESSNPSAGVIGQDGKFTGVALGNTNVTAKAPNTATPPALISSAATPVSVLSETLQSLTINPTGDVIVGDTQPFTVTANFTNGVSTNYTEQATWTSSDPAVATVSNTEGTKGDVTGVSAGIVTITATAPNTNPVISDSQSITVSQP